MHAKPNVHVGVGRMGKGDALLIDSTELDGGRGPSSSGAVARSPPLLACMNEPAAIHLTDRVRAAYTEHTAPVTRIYQYHYGYVPFDESQSVSQYHTPTNGAHGPHM